MIAEQRDRVRHELATDEDVRRFPYVDTVGKVTIGIGRNLTDRGISDAEIRYLLDNDINIALNAVVVFPWFTDLDPVRQRACVNLMFNLGYPRLCTFAKFLDAMGRKDYGTAAAELLDSQWAHQVQPSRRDRIVAQIRTGAEA